RVREFVTTGPARQFAVVRCETCDGVSNFRPKADVFQHMNPLISTSRQRAASMGISNTAFPFRSWKSTRWIRLRLNSGLFCRQPRPPILYLCPADRTVGQEVYR